MSLLPKLLMCCVLISVSFAAMAQEAVVQRPSPLAMATMKFNDTYVKITYSQPHKKGRDIFGGLVPFGQVWRTGANEATEITLTENLLVHEDTLKAGTYSVFTIPEKEQWTIIFNKNLGQWGSYNYVEKADALRVKAPVAKLKNVVYEPFTISFDQKNDKADLLMLWDETKVKVPLKFVTH